MVRDSSEATSPPAGFERDAAGADAAPSTSKHSTRSVYEAAEPGSLPLMALAAAGLAVFDAILAVAFVALWVMAPDTALPIIQSMAGVSLLLGVAPIVVGGLILNYNSRHTTKIPGTPWATWSIFAGLLLAAATVMIPLVSALRVLTGGGEL